MRGHLCVEIESFAFPDDLAKRIYAVNGDRREKSHLFQKLSIAIQRQCCLHSMLFSETVDILDYKSWIGDDEGDGCVQNG